MTTEKKPKATTSQRSLTKVVQFIFANLLCEGGLGEDRSQLLRTLWDIFLPPHAGFVILHRAAFNSTSYLCGLAAFSLTSQPALKLISILPACVWSLLMQLVLSRDAIRKGMLLEPKAFERRVCTGPFLQVWLLTALFSCRTALFLGFKSRNAFSWMPRCYRSTRLNW